MSISSSYTKAYERIEQEKTAEYLVDSYGTEDGYLPASYANAFHRFEKEAHVQNMVDTFAPDTQYIPAGYASALEKEAGFINMVKNTGSKLIRGGGSNLRKMKKGGTVARANGKFVLGDKAGLGDAAKFYLNKGKRQLGAQMIKNPGTTAAIGAGVGVAGVGGGAYMMGRD
jgi:hypothetical protein